MNLLWFSSKGIILIIEDVSLALATLGDKRNLGENSFSLRINSSLLGLPSFRWEKYFENSYVTLNE